MPRSFVKSLPEYEADSTILDPGNILAALRRQGTKRPTSVALDDETVRSLKALAKPLGLPYQVLMRAIILEGVERVRARISRGATGGAGKPKASRKRRRLSSRREAPRGGA
jgi:hypothetical protein